MQLQIVNGNKKKLKNGSTPRAEVSWVSNVFVVSHCRLRYGVKVIQTFFLEVILVKPLGKIKIYQSFKI